MRTFAEKPKSAQQATPSKSTVTGRAYFGQSREVSSILHSQRTIGNQAVQRILQVNHEKRDDSPFGGASPRFAHDFSRLPVHANQVAPRATPKGLAVIPPRDMKGPATEEDADRLVDEAGPGPAPAVSPPPSPAAPSPVLPGPPAPSPLSLTVTVPGHIRAASSPTGMPDRIPPRVDTPVSIGITGWSIPMRDVTISVDGTGGGNGTVTVNGANSVDLNASGTVQLRGVNQTNPGKAGGLRLVARQGPAVLASSANFSVSSIPQNWSMSFHSLITGGRRGFVVNDSWESDSGQVADLDQAEISEQVQYGAGSGCLSGAGAGAQNSGYLPANTFSTDSHSTPVGLITGVGSIVAEQTSIFKDNRTGSNNIPVKNSGYRLTRNVTEPTPGNLEITTTKQGTATTANGFSSGAGSGTVSRTQAV